MKIVFFGSDDFALKHLERLYDSSHEVVACVTQPDRAKGRGMKVILSPIKEFAFTKGIVCLQPNDIHDGSFNNQLKELEADVFVVIAYGRILPQSILDIPKKIPINIHGSLLPQYRGAAPINWAIINGETMTGLTAIKMNTKMDAGAIIGQKQVAIEPQDTSISLRTKMMDVGAGLLMDVLKQIEENTQTLKEQNEKEVTIASKLTKDLGIIDWNKSTLEINNLIRGLVPWPGAYTQYKGKQLKVYTALTGGENQAKHEPGTVLNISKKGIDVMTGDGVLCLGEVQLESSKRMSAHAFSVGHEIKKGMKFEN